MWVGLTEIEEGTSETDKSVTVEFGFYDFQKYKLAYMLYIVPVTFALRLLF
jgi:hypothetical protein